MHRKTLALLLVAGNAALVPALRADDAKPADPAAPPVAAPVKTGPEPTDVAAPKMGKDGQIQAGFQSQHESFLKRGKEGKIGVLFVGDSITAGWKGSGAGIWQAHYGAYDAANFGIGGDRTQHVLWRIEKGELDGIAPKIARLAGRFRLS